MSTQRSATVHFIDRDINIGHLTDPVWENTQAVLTETYWNGEKAPLHRQFSSSMLWSTEHFYLRFLINQGEPVVASASPNTQDKTIGLWDRDVCEVFIAPDEREPRRYFEFEIAPTGEWLDLSVDLTSGSRRSDPGYLSGMEAAAKMETTGGMLAIKVPWAAFGRIPKPGESWLGNLFRCVGERPRRGYLSWRPTLTDIPNFHVPEAFGAFEFID